MKTTLRSLGLIFIWALVSTVTLRADQLPPTLICPLLSSAPRIDGNIELGEWSSASAMTGLHWLGGEKLAERQATFWLMRDQQALYLAVRVPMPEGAKPVANEKKHDGSVWEDDAVEVFIDPGATRESYFQFIINSAGVTYDAHRPSGGWDGPYDCKTSTAMDHWDMEMRVPFASLGAAAPKPGELWGLNVCSDRKTPNGELSTWAPLAGNFHDPASFGRLMFVEDASRVQLLSLGSIEKGRLGFKGDMLARGGASSRLIVTKNSADVSKAERQAAGDSATSLNWDCELPREKDRPAPGDYRATLEVTSSDHRVLAKAAFSFHINPPLVVTLHPYNLRARKLIVDLEAKSMDVSTDQIAMKAEIHEAGSEKVVLTKTLDSLGADAKATAEFDTTNLPAGKYILSAQALRKGTNQVIEETKQPFEKPATPPWFGSKAGVSDKVLPPWTPIKVKGTTVEPWGRQYVYDTRPFPSQIMTHSQSVLAGPIRVLATVDGKQYAAQGGRMKVQNQSPAVVILSYQSSLGSLKFDAEVAVEYDGMVRHDFRLEPTNKAKLDSLVVEIPLKAENAKYLYHFPGSWSSSSNTGMLPAEGYTSGFKPFIWLGDEDRGLAWLSESDQYWFTKDPSKAIEIVREGQQVILRLNIITTPVEISPSRSQTRNSNSKLDIRHSTPGTIAYTFGLQATPVKPVTEDVWDMRIVHAGYYGLEQQPYHGESSLTYPAEGNINLKQGSLEMWVRPFFDPHVKVEAGVSLGSYNRTLFMVRLPAATVDLYWNIEDRGLRFYVNEGDRYPILFTTHQDWKPGELHHVALTWGDAVSLYIDGQLVHRQAWQGLTARVLKDGQLVIGGNTCEFAVDEIRISDIPRAEFDLTTAPGSDEHTLLLDHLDESIKPDGEHATQPAKSGARKGGLVSEMASFAPVKYGNGLLLYSEEKGPAKTYLDRLAELGVRTIVFHEHWTDIQNYTSTTHGEQLHRLVKACHERGIKLLLYFGYLFADIAPEYPLYFDECMVYPRTGDYSRSPAQTDYSVCYRSPWQDFIADGIAKVMDEYDIDGVYLDGTEYPWPCRNLHHGCGYLRPDGTVGTSYSIFPAREMVKRIYTVVRQRKPDGLVNCHNSTNMVIPTFSFTTSTWDGEQFGGMDRGAFALDILPLEAFRCEFMGRQWGVPSEFLCYNRPWTYREALSFTLLHDVLVRGTAEDESKLWRAMDEFGRKKAQFRPYWSNSDVVTTDSPDTKVSVWTRGAAGAMLVVSNLGKERRDATLTLNLKSLRLKPTTQAVDAISKAPISMNTGQITIPLDSLDWKMVRVK